MLVIKWDFEQAQEMLNGSQEFWGVLLRSNNIGAWDSATWYLLMHIRASAGGSDHSLPAIRETQVWSLSKENPLEKEMATHSSILAWEIPWTKEPGSLSYMELQRELDTTEQLTLSLSCISMVRLFTKVLQSLFLIIIATFSSRSCHAHFQMRKSSLDPK